MRKLAIIMLMLLLTAYAEDYVAINSMDGRDVLSGVFYANVKGLPVKFMPITGDSDVLATKVGSGHDVLLIQGSLPVSSFVETALENRNNTIELYTSADAGATNLDLAKRSGARRFIIVDSAYSDSALSVIPYAAMTESYILLASKNNIAEIKDIVEGADKIIIYGLVDREVSSELAGFSPEAMGTGDDKFKDNVLVVDRTMDEFSLTTVTIVDGSFLEEAMAAGDQPILLSGRLVPQGTYDFIKTKVRSNELNSVLLIGNELVVPIYDMRERMEREFEGEGLNKSFGIVVKFAQVVPSAGTGVLVLDTFPMPSYKPELEIKEIVYNEQSGNVMASVDNVGEGAAYYTIEVRIRVDGSDYRIFGSNETTLIQRGEQLGSEYPLDLSGVAEGNVTAVAIVKYGASRTSLEEFISEEGPLATITYTDASDVSVQSARYDSGKDSVLVTIRNNGDQAAYVFSKLSLVIGGEPATITSPATRSIDAGSLIVEEFPLQLSEEDMAANKNVTVLVDYGGRPGFLMKHAAYIVNLEETGEFPLLLLVLVGLGLIVIVAVAYFLIGRRKGKG